MNNDEIMKCAILAVFGIIPVSILCKIYNLHPIILLLYLFIFIGGVMMLLLNYSRGNE